MGRLGSGQWEYPCLGVSWENAGTDVAVLVTVNQRESLEAHLYGFAAQPREIGAMLWRLKPGRYQVTLTPAEGFSDGGIVASLLTAPHPDQQLDLFYELMRTPVRPGEVSNEPCRLPEGTPPAPRRPLLPWKQLEIMKPARVTVVGFCVGWICVLALIYGFAALIPGK